MELIARNFECYPVSSFANQLLGPLVANLSQVRFPVVVGERNSNQLNYFFDPRLEAGLIEHGAIQAEFNLPSHIKQKYDFTFAFRGKQVVVSPTGEAPMAPV